MDYVRFGTSDLTVSRLGLGCMSMSGAYGKADDKESIATLHEAFDKGINFIDTSHSYGEGHNHKLIAQALKGRKDRIIIHSKSGSPRLPEGSTSAGGGAPAYLTQVCEESVRNLGVERLDIYCMSRVDPNVPVEESVGAMAKLIERGLTRYIGLSEASAATLRRASKVHPLVSLQIEFNLLSRDAEEKGNVAACEELGLHIMAYSPLGRGLISGDFKKTSDLPAGDRRADAPRFRPGNIEKNAELLAKLSAIAKEKGATLPQLALAWLMAKGKVIPIPSNKTRKHLNENLKAADLRLSQDDMKRIEAIVPYGAAAGTRVAEKDMKRVNA
jgi:aryl-alcohol dehydrogenase-like predicted oxidoreductase